ncbi:MAG: SUMF1/EgtB/PvdO family nonheme iron enzyme [Anaerolineae bacterium]|nr:SUMF1/EgtB/PvdO family nonheme iron enzyme [Anaerolineae bacterium]
MPRIFVSYSRQDRTFAQSIVNDLERIGADVWIDYNDIRPGHPWPKEVKDALGICGLMLLILSPKSMDSEHVEEEWRYFQNQGRLIIPLQLYPTRVPPGIRELQYIDFHAQEYKVAFAQLHFELLQQEISLEPLSTPNVQVPIPRQPPLKVQRPTRSRPRWIVSAVVIALLIVGIVFVTQVFQDSNGTDKTLLRAIERAQDFFEGNADWEAYISNYRGIELALVPAGCFMMGSDSGDTDESPPHRVCFSKPFWIGRTEITNAQYGSIGAFSGDQRPRESITWVEAFVFCASLGGRLPNEAEWEFAARGPNMLEFPWGDDFVPENTVYGNMSGGTSVVGSKPEGASWVGALDMSGNVWEWVMDTYDSTSYNDHGNTTLTDPAAYISTKVRNYVEQDIVSYTDPNIQDLVEAITLLLAKERQVIRGGAFDSNERGLRAANRSNDNPNYSYIHNGFRCAFSIEDISQEID